MEVKSQLNIQSAARDRLGQAKSATLARGAPSDTEPTKGSPRWIPPARAVIPNVGMLEAAIGR